jgi:hypothetical protein
MKMDSLACGELLWSRNCHIKICKELERCQNFWLIDSSHLPCKSHEFAPYQIAVALFITGNDIAHKIKSCKFLHLSTAY